MKNFLGSAIILLGIIIGLSAPVNAQSIFDRCIVYIENGEIDDAKKLALMMKNMRGISNDNFSNAEKCLGLIGVKPQKNVELKRLELEEMKEQIAQLNKRLSCISAKSSQVITQIDIIDKQNDDTNRFLILHDTHNACSDLYSSDKLAAVLNQSCTEAFQHLGHPNLVLAKEEQKSVYDSQLIDLTNLVLSLKVDLQDRNTEANILTFRDRTVQETNRWTSKVQGIIQRDNEVLEAKSCAEFGYEGVYLD